MEKHGKVSFKSCTFLLKKWDINGNIGYSKSIKARVMRAGYYFWISRPDNDAALFCAFRQALNCSNTKKGVF